MTNTEIINAVADDLGCEVVDPKIERDPDLKGVWYVRAFGHGMRRDFVVAYDLDFGLVVSEVNLFTSWPPSAEERALLDK